MTNKQCWIIIIIRYAVQSTLKRSQSNTKVTNSQRISDPTQKYRQLWNPHWAV